jgi:hypothetical protein
MYTDNDILSHHDRAAEGLLRQMTESGCGRENGFSYPSEPFLRGGCGEDKARLEDSHHSWGLVDYPLAMVYSPVQKWQNIYDGETALVRGTIFEELDLPFVGKCYCEKEGCWGDGNKCGGGRNG